MNSDGCPVCYKRIENEGLVEPCSHLFCLECIQTWTELHAKVTCPVCRNKIKSINGCQLLETSITRDAIGEGQVDATRRCELCHEPLEILGRLECFYCGYRLDRCEQCIESLLTNDEVAWSCPSCGRLAPCPTPSTVNSTFSIEESPYALYEFDQGVTNSRDNLSSSISSNSAITHQQDSNVVEYIMENMNRTHNTPGLTNSPSDKKEKIKKTVKAALLPYYKNKAISKQEYRHLLGKIVCKIIKSRKRLSRTAVERLAEEYIRYQRERSRRGL